MIGGRESRQSTPLKFGRQLFEERLSRLKLPQVVLAELLERFVQPALIASLLGGSELPSPSLEHTDHRHVEPPDLSTA